MNRISFSVDGQPVGQGSMKAYVRGGHAVVTHAAGSALAVWRQSVAARAAAAVDGADLVVGPVAVRVIFLVRRPSSHYGARGTVTRRYASPWAPSGADLDKLARAVLDALSGIIYVDDRQVVVLRAERRYAEDGRIGADVEVVEIDTPAGVAIDQVELWEAPLT